MADDGNAMKPERRNALAGYNQELIDALMNPPKQEPWAWTKSMPTLAEFLRQGLQYAPLGFAFRGPIQTGSPAGLRMQDFRRAPEVEAYARAREPVVGRHDPAIVGGGADPTTSAAPLGEMAKYSTPNPFRAPEVPADPYDAAVAWQMLARRAANK